MSTLEQIEAAILTLPSDDFEKLRKWFFDLDYQRCDKQLEKDIAEGKLEVIAELFSVLAINFQIIKNLV